MREKKTEEDVDRRNKKYCEYSWYEWKIGRTQDIKIFGGVRLGLPNHIVVSVRRDRRKRRQYFYIGEVRLL